GLAPLYPLRRRPLCPAWWSHPCGPAQGLAGRQLFAGWGQQRYLGAGRRGTRMLSRVADSIYWMHRYIERAENVARFIDVNLRLLLDLPPGTTEQWQPLVDTTGDHALFRERYGQATQEHVIRFLTFDTSNPNSIYSCLRMARENARSVREVISSEMWEQLNRFYLMVRNAAATAGGKQTPHELFTEVKMASHLFVGITDATMSHGEGWHFGRLGRLIER